MGRPTRVRYLVLAALCAAAVLAYIHRNWLSVPATSIQEDLGIDRFDFAFVLSAFYLGYSLFQVPGGYLADRFGTRRVLPILIAVWSSAAGLIALVESYPLFLLLHLINGVAQAGIFPCCVKSILRWFPERSRAFPSGMLASFMQVGGMVATGLTGLLLLFLDWRQVVALLAMPGLLFAALFFLWFRDDPAEHPGVNEDERDLIRDPPVKRAGSVPSASATWQECVLTWHMALICGQQFFRAAAYIFYATWFPTFLQEARGISVAGSGLLTSLPLFGVALGSLAGGWAMDLILRRTGSLPWSRKGVGLGCVLLSGLFLASAFFVSDPAATIALIMLSTFFAGATGPAGYTVTMDLGGRNVGVVFSVMNMAGNLGATLLPLAVEVLVSKTSWNHALLFVAGLYGAAGLCWALLRIPTRNSHAPR